MVRFRGVNYFIAGCTDSARFPFFPADVDIDVTEASTANYRGFYCRYVVGNENLTLLSATLHLTEREYRRAIRGEARKLYECRPEPLRVLSRELGLKGLIEGVRWKDEANYVKYDDIWQVIRFSGGLLIGRNRESTSGSLSAWTYDELWEVVLDDGVLQGAEDRSHAMQSFRDWLRDQDKSDGDNQGSVATKRSVDRDEATSLLKSYFALELPLRLQVLA